MLNLAVIKPSISFDTPWGINSETKLNSIHKVLRPCLTQVRAVSTNLKGLTAPPDYSPELWLENAIWGLRWALPSILENPLGLGTLRVIGKNDSTAGTTIFTWFPLDSNLK